MINKILFSLLALFWGGSFIAIKYLIHDVPSYTAAFYRVALAWFFLIIIFIKSLKIPQGFFGKELLYSAIAGMCSIGIPFGLLFWGERYIAASLAGVLNGTVPFWTLLIAIVFLNQGKKVTKEKIIGLMAGFVGILLIFGPKLTLSGNKNELLGILAILMMSFFYGIGTNLNRTTLINNKIITGPISLIIQHFISAIYLGIIAYNIDGPFDFQLLMKPENALSLFYLSFFSTSLAFIIFFKLIKEMGSVEASSVTFFVPAVALILDMIISGNILSISEAFGTAVIFLSMFFLRQKKA